MDLNNLTDILSSDNSLIIFTISSILQHSHSLKSDLNYKPSTIFQQIKVKRLSKGQRFIPAKPMKHQLTLDAQQQRTLGQIHRSTVGVGYLT